MSITLLSGVTTYHSTEYLYTPIYFALSGDNTSFLNHKFIVDIAVNNEFAGRYRFTPNPITKIGHFDISDIISNYVDNQDFNPTITSPLLNNSGIVHYVLAFGEEYDLSLSLTAATGTTIYPFLLFKVGYGLNAVNQPEETYKLHDYDWNQMTGSHKTKFLTDWNYNYNKKIFHHEYETTCIFTTIPTFSVAKYQVITYDPSGSTLGSYLFDISGGTPFNNYRHELPIGTQNFYINAFNFVTSTTDLIMKPNVGSYYVIFYDTSFHDSVQWNFQINDKCTRFDKVRLCWLNSLGYYDYFTCYLANRTYLLTNKTEWSKKVDYDYSIGKRGRTVLNSNGQKSFTVTTDWLTDAESEFISNLWIASHVFLIDSSGQKIPLIYKGRDHEIKTLDNDRLINYSMEFDFSHKTYRQNG
jgi:hypothetical protein